MLHPQLAKLRDLVKQWHTAGVLIMTICLLTGCASGAGGSLGTQHLRYTWTSTTETTCPQSFQRDVVSCFDVGYIPFMMGGGAPIAKATVEDCMQRRGYQQVGTPMRIPEAYYQPFAWRGSEWPWPSSPPVSAWGSIRVFTGLIYYDAVCTSGGKTTPDSTASHVPPNSKTASSASPSPPTPPVSPGTASDGAFDFKGIEVDGRETKPAQVHAALDGGRWGVKCGAGASNFQVCNGSTTVGGASADVNLVINAQGKVIRINLSFGSVDFERVEETAFAKYGTPTRTANEVVQNRMGAQFQNVTHEWTGLSGRYIRLSKYVGTIDEGHLYFGSAQDTELLRKVTGGKKGDM
jgi:hypothetical protein